MPITIENLATVQTAIPGLTPLVYQRDGDQYLIFVLKGHHNQRRHRTVGSLGECVACWKRLNQLEKSKRPTIK